MALSHKHRTTIYQRWSPTLGEEATEALLAHFPARDLDEPVTKEFVRAEIVALELRTKEYTGRRIAASTAFLAVLVTVFGFLD